MDNTTNHSWEESIKFQKALETCPTIVQERYKEAQRSQWKMLIENARLREAITEFAKADKGLRRDYTEYCDEEGYPPDWVYEEDEAFHNMWDKAVANLLEIAEEEALKEGNDE